MGTQKASAKVVVGSSNELDRALESALSLQAIYLGKRCWLCWNSFFLSVMNRWQKTLEGGFGAALIALAIVNVLYLTISSTVSELSQRFKNAGGAYNFALNM